MEEEPEKPAVTAAQAGDGEAASRDPVHIAPGPGEHVSPDAPEPPSSDPPPPALEPATHGGALRNLADVLLETLFSRLLGARGPVVLAGCLVVAGLWLVIRDYRTNGRDP